VVPALGKEFEEGTPDRYLFHANAVFHKVVTLISHLINEFQNLLPGQKSQE
jgi:hypothetical protein